MKLFQVIFSMLLLGLMSFKVAFAALPVVIGTTLTQVSADAVALGDLVWPIVVTIFGAVLLFKLFKRFGSKI